MSQTPSSAAASTVAGTPRASQARGSGLLASLRALGRKLSQLVRWVAGRLRSPLGQVARSLMQSWVAEHVPAPLRWLGRLFAPGRERGFGFWWLVATFAVALVLGLVVALVLTPVAGLIALLVVAIWALVRRRRHKRREQRERALRAPASEAFPEGSDGAPASVKAAGIG